MSTIKPQCKLPKKMQSLFQRFIVIENGDNDRCEHKIVRKDVGDYRHVVCDSCGAVLVRVRYKTFVGGRGGGKSHGVAQYVVLMMLQGERWVCAREVQGSIRESVHKLLTIKIEEMGLRDFFNITDTYIKCPQSGGEAVFVGLFRNVHNVKSLEDCDGVWIEEAEAVSEETWVKLIPTIRNEESEIVCTFNTRYLEDATYKRLVTNQPFNGLVTWINWYDNEFFPDVLRIEMEQDKVRDPDLYEHVWEGKPLLIGSRVWPDFDKVVHVRDIGNKELKEELKANFFMSIDPHSAFYPAILWGAVFPINGGKNWPEDYVKYIYDEWPKYEDIGGYYSDLRKKLYYNGSLKDLAKIIYTRDGTAEFGIEIRKRFVDTRFAKAAGGANWSTSTQGLIQEWSKRENGGILLDMPAEKLLSSIKMVLSDELKYNKLMPIGEWNQPKVYVHSRCKNLIQSLLNHRCVEGKEQEDETYKDFSDAFRIMRAGIVDSKWRDGYKDKTLTAEQYAIMDSDNLSWMAA